MLMILINENALRLADDLRGIDDAIRECTDEARLAELRESRKLVADTLQKMLDRAIHVSRRKADEMGIDYVG